MYSNIIIYIYMAPHITTTGSLADTCSYYHPFSEFFLPRAPLLPAVRCRTLFAAASDFVPVTVKSPETSAHQLGPC